MLLNDNDILFWSNVLFGFTEWSAVEGNKTRSPSTTETGKGLSENIVYCVIGNSNSSSMWCAVGAKKIASGMLSDNSKQLM